MNKIKKYIIFSIIPILALAAVKTCLAQSDLLLSYPNLGEAGTLSLNTSVPALIKYLYVFALGAAGIVALISILIGAGKYIFSAGNSSKAADAKDQIFSAVLGLLILISSVLILRTINPDLVNIRLYLEPINPTLAGVQLGAGNEHYSCSCRCCTMISGLLCNDWGYPQGFQGCQTFVGQQYANLFCGMTCYKTCTTNLGLIEIRSAYQYKTQACNR